MKKLASEVVVEEEIQLISEQHTQKMELKQQIHPSPSIGRIPVRKLQTEQNCKIYFI